MGERRRLPDRRESETFTLECGGLAYDDGQLGEIFLTGRKVGTDTDVAARDSAVVCSIALQFGADVSTIRKALCRDARGQAGGPLGVALDRLAAERAP